MNKHTNLVVPHQVAHRIKHAIAVVAGKRNRLMVKNANKSWIAAFVGHGRPALVIDSRQKKHVSTFDERLMLRRNFGKHQTFFDIVSKPPRVEALLQRAMDGSIQSAHVSPPNCK